MTGLVTTLREAEHEIELCLQASLILSARLQNTQNWVLHVAGLMGQLEYNTDLAHPYKGCSLDLDQAQMYRDHLRESLDTIAAQLRAMR